MDLDPLYLAIRIPVLLLALTLHEFSHAYSAYRLGDPTAYRMGRCTLNPLAHLDPIGALCLLFAPIGWAKPVPVNPLNFRRPGRDDILVSAAGPASNFALALVFALVLRAIVGNATEIRSLVGPYGFSAIHRFCFFGVLINVGLGVFNLLPVYPLDGFHVWGNLMKGDSQRRFFETARFGTFIIIGLVLLSRTPADPLGRIIDPVLAFFLDHVAGLGLSLPSGG